MQEIGGSASRWKLAEYARREKKTETDYLEQVELLRVQLGHWRGPSCASLDSMKSVDDTDGRDHIAE